MVLTPNNITMQDAKTGQVPKEQADLIIKKIMDTSVVTRLAKYQEMDKLEKEFTYLAEGAGAYWVEEGKVIQTSSPKWLSCKLVAKKLAVIIPVSKETLNYSTPEFFALMQNEIAQAFQMKFDASALFGTDTPFASGISIYERAKEANHEVERTDNLYADLNNAIGFVEDGDNEAQAIVTLRKYNKDLRGTLDTRNLPIFNDAREGVTATALGLPIAYAGKTAWDEKKAEMLTGDFDHAFYGIPQQIEYKISEEGTLSSIVDESGKPINLFERDLVALRAIMYIGFLTVKEDAFALIKPKATV